MKTKIFTLVVMAIGLLASTSAFAENESDVSLGGQITFTINTTNDNGNAKSDGYNWEIRNSSGSVVETFDAEANSIDVIFTSPKYSGGTYTVWVQFEDNNGCLSDPITREIKVSDSKWDLDNETNTTTCSLLNGDVTGNTEEPDKTSFTVEIANSFGTYTIEYKVGSVAFTATSYSSGSEIEVNYLSTSPDVTDEFTNIGTTGKDVTIQVVKVTDSNGFDISKDTKDSYTVEVHPKSTIDWN